TSDNEEGLPLEILNRSETRGSGGSEGPEPESGRSCWICFATDEDNRLAVWLQPCKCRGTTKWVHQSCLHRWIDEKQNGNHRRVVVCQQCQTEYIIQFPKMNKLATALECIDYAVRRVCPFVTAGVFFGCVYWTALTYGAFTVVQIIGQKRGIELIEDWCPYVFIILPAIPTGLILSRLIRWENIVLRVMRSKYNILRKLPLLHWLGEPEVETGGGDDNTDDLPPVQVDPFSDPLNIYRIFCGAMLLPTIATVVGGLLFQRYEDPLQRTLLGGVTYIVVKGLLKIYLRQKLYIRSRRRRILDYTDENVRLHMGGEIREAPAQDQNRNPRVTAGYVEHYEPDDNFADFETDNARPPPEENRTGTR
ncbi:hypothetical protein KR059_006333, partial [Drosophila kikkawai]